MQTNAKVLITGVAGLLGSHLATYLLDKGYDVIGIDNLSGGYKDFVDKRLIETNKFSTINLLDAGAVRKVFALHRPQYVYHFAAYAAEGLSPFIRNFNYQNNLLCSVNIINQCIEHDCKKIIFTSSMAVYGHGTPPFTEDMQPHPADPYGIAKYSVEMDIKQAHEQFGLKYTIVRPHNVVGIRQNIWDKYRNVVGIWIRQTLKNEPMLIYGDGLQKRAFSDIRFYLEPFEKLMATGDGEIFNIGSDKEYTLKETAELVQKIGKEFGYAPNIRYVESRLEVKHAFCNHDKAKRMLGFHDDTNLETTIRDMFAWAKDQPDRPIKLMEYELHKNIYSYWKPTDGKLKLPNVTLFAVACTKVDQTIHALKQSMQGVQFAEALLLTHEKINLDEYGIHVINIEKLDYKGYNHFILYRAKDYIKTDYALLVQNDGYVLRPDRWDNRFFEYDYIGAPWTPHTHFTKEGKEVRIGNGGFSFRSKKLLHAFTNLNLPFTDNGTGFWHEDGNISVYYRKELEEYGIKFPPLDIASQFSREVKCDGWVRYPFGFHNVRNIPWLYPLRKYLHPILKKFNLDI